MTPKQRAAALRLADKLDAVDVDVRDEFCVDTAAALLRELAAAPDHMDELRKACAELLGNDPATWPSHGNAPLAIAASMAILCKAAEPDDDAKYRCGGPGCDGNCCQPVQEPIGYMTSGGLDYLRSGVGPIGVWPTPQADSYKPVYDHPQQKAEPVQEPVIWIQSNHLQHAKNGPYLARTGPTKLMSDFIPLYAAPQQRKPLSDAFVSQVVRSVQPNLSATCKAWAEQFDECKYWLDAAHEIGEQK